MKKIIAYATIILAIGLIFSNPITADTSHQGHGQMQMPATDAPQKNHEQMQMPATGTFKQQMVDKHIRAEFQVMSLASMNMKDPNGATHHIMVKLFNEKMNHQIRDAVGKVKVIGPDNKEQAAKLKNYNGIFAANFTLSNNGKYGVICLVKVDGEKHLYKFWYQQG